MNAPTTENLLPVELHGGPFDGHCNEVAMHPDMLDRYLFEKREAGWVQRIAYKPANRSTKNGRRWVLNFDCVVSRQKLQGS